MVPRRPPSPQQASSFVDVDVGGGDSVLWWRPRSLSPPPPPPCPPPQPPPPPQLPQRDATCTLAAATRDETGGRDALHKRWAEWASRALAEASALHRAAARGVNALRTVQDKERVARAEAAALQHRRRAALQARLRARPLPPPPPPTLLPPEVLRGVVAHLTGGALFAVRRVCRSFNSAAVDAAGEGAAAVAACLVRTTRLSALAAFRARVVRVQRWWRAVRGGVRSLALLHTAAAAAAADDDEGAAGAAEARRAAAKLLQRRRLQRAARRAGAGLQAARRALFPGAAAADEPAPAPLCILTAPQAVCVVCELGEDEDDLLSFCRCRQTIHPMCGHSPSRCSKHCNYPGRSDGPRTCVAHPP